MFFWKLRCFLHDPTNVGNLISGSSASLKPSLYIWKFSVHVLLRPSLKIFSLTLLACEMSAVVVWTFFGIALLWAWNENWPFPVLCIRCLISMISSHCLGPPMASLHSLALWAPALFWQLCIQWWGRQTQVLSSLVPSVQSLSHVRLCDPMNRSTPGLPVHHQLPESTQTHVHWVSDAIQPSHPVSSPSPPAPSLSQYQGLFKWVSSSHQVVKVLEFHLQNQSYQWTPRTDLLYLFFLI